MQETKEQATEVMNTSIANMQGEHEQDTQLHDITLAELVKEIKKIKNIIAQKQLPQGKKKLVLLKKHGVFVYITSSFTKT